MALIPQILFQELNMKKMDTTSALTAVENKISNVTSLVKKY